MSSQKINSLAYLKSLSGCPFFTDSLRVPSLDKMSINQLGSSRNRSRYPNILVVLPFEGNVTIKSSVGPAFSSCPRGRDLAYRDTLIRMTMATREGVEAPLAICHTIRKQWGFCVPGNNFETPSFRHRIFGRVLIIDRISSLYCPGRRSSLSTTFYDIIGRVSGSDFINSRPPPWQREREGDVWVLE